MAQTPAEDGVRNQAEDLGHSGFTGFIHTKGSQGVCFVLLDMGLSQLMPNTRQFRQVFPPCTKFAKTAIFALKGQNR